MNGDFIFEVLGGGESETESEGGEPENGGEGEGVGDLGGDI